GLVLPTAEIEELLTGAGKPLSGPVDDDENIQALSVAIVQAEERIRERRAASLTGPIPLPLAPMARLFNLSRFEENCLLACLAPEIDRKYEKIYAYLQDDLTCKSPCVELLLDLFCDAEEEKLAARAAFAPAGNLLKYRLLLPVDRSQ